MNTPIKTPTSTSNHDICCISTIMTFNMQFMQHMTMCYHLLFLTGIRLKLLIENSHSSSSTICMQNRVEVGGTIRNYSELICQSRHFSERELSNSQVGQGFSIYQHKWAMDPFTLTAVKVTQKQENARTDQVMTLFLNHMKFYP